MRKQGNKKRFLADAPMPGIPLTEILGNRRVLIENHLGILAYSADEICIKVKKGSVRVEGEALIIDCISSERVVITGRIFGIRLYCEV